ncbi:MAG: PilN domain-containing protein [Oscillospiraceae bacterium]|nr:PilN domain-containing protein [Oscillospiraceae bacterium]
MRKRKTAPDILAGALAAALVLLSSAAVADIVKGTRLFRQGRFAAAVFSQQSMSLAGVAAEPEKLDAALKFLGAVTAAYINFEMIPVGEARTFAAVFQSLESGIAVEQFSYKGKTLEITGISPDNATSERFRRNLERQGYLLSVSYHAYVTVDDDVRFSIECALP